MKILDVIKRIFIEKHCLACGSPVSYNVDEPFCEQCADSWRRFKNARCHMCGRERELCACLPKYARQVNHSIVGWCVFYNAFENGIINLMFKYLKSVYDKQVIDFCTDWMMRAILVTAKSRGIDLSAYTVTYAPRSLTGVKKIVIPNAFINPAIVNIIKFLILISFIDYDIAKIKMFVNLKY